MTAIYLYDAVRTPRGKAKADGALAKVAPHELVRQCIAAVDARTGGGARDPEALLLGCVGQVGAQGGNIAMVAKLHAGLPDVAGAYTINNYCVSGLTAIGQAARVAAEIARPILAGGVETMSRVPFMADRADYYGDATFPTRTRYVPVAVAADRLAATSGIGRAALDAAAYRSQSRAVAAEGTALIASRIAVTGDDGQVVLDRDECVRLSTPEKLAAMPTAFGGIIAEYADALGGEAVVPVHSIAHAPPMCDAAALALVGAEGAVDAAPRARIVAYAEAGGDPQESLTAGFTAMARVLDRAGLTLGDMDRIEFMEAFAVTIARFLRDYPADPERVNVGGGHLARGHPLGASGAILLSTLLDALDASQGRYGLVVACGASGVGAAIVVERVAAQ